MTYYHWLGRDGEPDTYSFDDAIEAIFQQARSRVVDHIASCKPEADGFITVHPKVRTWNS